MQYKVRSGYVFFGPTPNLVYQAGTIIDDSTTKIAGQEHKLEPATVKAEPQAKVETPKEPEAANNGQTATSATGQEQANDQGSGDGERSSGE